MSNVSNVGHDALKCRGVQGVYLCNPANTLPRFASGRRLARKVRAWRHESYSRGARKPTAPAPPAERICLLARSTSYVPGGGGVLV